MDRSNIYVMYKRIRLWELDQMFEHESSQRKMKEEAKTTLLHITNGKKGQNDALQAFYKLLIH